jgi:CspA family cold shock protein
MPRLSSLRQYDREDQTFERDRDRVEYPKPALVKAEGTRITGSIRKLKQDRGFGFIAGDDGQDHFFHWSGMEKTTKNFRDLEVQDRVSFVSVIGDKGPRAVMIRVITDV